MRICIVYHGGEFPPSERIEKSARTLTAAGHEVFLFCNNYGKFRLSDEQVGDVHVVRVRPTFRSYKLNKILKFPVFIHPLWVVQLFAMLRRFKIEAIQVVDMPLGLLTLAAGKVFGIPVVTDMWENYPEALRGWGEQNWRTWVFKNYRIARLIEAWAMPRMDHIITVVDEQRDRLISDGVRPERVSVVTNAVDMEMFAGSPAHIETALAREPSAYKLLYVGMITIERGLDDIIRALPLLRSRIPEVLLFIAGMGNDEPRLRALAEQEGVRDAVRFLGLVPFNHIHSYIQEAHLCLVPHVNNDFINTTIPNKIFQYMALAKPILVSNAKPLARIIRESSCGFVFESGNPQDAAGKIAEAYDCREDHEIGLRGRRCVEEKYTWDHVSRELVRVYRDLDRARPTSLG